ETIAARRKAKRRRQEYETSDARRVESRENRRQCPPGRMAHDQRCLSTCLLRHCRDRLADRSHRVIAKACVFLAAPRRHPLEEVQAKAILQAVAHYAHGFREVPDVWAFDRSSDNKQRRPGASVDIGANPPARTGSNNPVTALSWSEA